MLGVIFNFFQFQATSQENGTFSKNAEACLRPRQLSMMELFTIVVDISKVGTISSKRSIIDV